MDYKAWRTLGVFAIIGALISFAVFVGMSRTPNHYVRNHYKSVGNGVYQCEGDPKEVADRIADKTSPKAQAADPKTGEQFLRYHDKIVRVSNRGPTRCEIRVESDSTYRSGGFVYLGPGFSPSSPHGSSGGSSGSSGGVK